jgi:hypothetical protein
MEEKSHEKESPAANNSEQDKDRKTQEKVGRLSERDEAVALLGTGVWKTKDKNKES